MGNINLITVFTTGLLTGGLTCMAVQGGLLAATIAQQQELRLKQQAKKSGNALPIIAFLQAKLIAYTLLGFILGWIGSFFSLSIQAQVILQIAVSIFMIGTALNMLNVHPLFRYFIIQPPRFLSRFVRKQSKRHDIFAPSLLGAFTIFIPCGTTQAMMALAIGSGSPLLGAAVLFAFVLGTSPIFFLLGYFATKLGDVFQTSFTKIGAVAILVLAVFTLNNSMALAGTPYTVENAFQTLNCVISFCPATKDLPSTQNISTDDGATITITDAGYYPNTLTVKHGDKVTLKLINNGAQGCTQAFTIPQLNVQKVVPTGSSDSVTFTAPDKPTELAFMCSMGMYRGTIKVI